MTFIKPTFSYDDLFNIGLYETICFRYTDNQILSMLYIFRKINGIASFVEFDYLE